MAFVGFVNTTRAARAEHSDASEWQRFAGSARKAHMDDAGLARHMSWLPRASVKRDLCVPHMHAPYVHERLAMALHSGTAPCLALASNKRHDITRTWQDEP